MSKLKKVLDEIILKGYTITEEGIVKNPKGKIIIGSVTGMYRKFAVRTQEFISFSVKVHRFQGYIKYGESIFDTPLVLRHIDSNSLNNHYNNIVLGTISENIMDMPKEVRIMMAASGRKHDHKAIIKDRQEGLSLNQIRLKYNISSKGTVNYIISKSLEKQKENVV